MRLTTAVGCGILLPPAELDRLVNAVRPSSFRNRCSVLTQLGGGPLRRWRPPAIPQDGDLVRLVMRAEKLHPSAESAGAPRDTRWNGRIDTVDYQGQAARYFVTVGSHSLQVIKPIDSRPFTEGEEVPVHVHPHNVVLLTPEA